MKVRHFEFGIDTAETVKEMNSFLAGVNYRDKEVVGGVLLIFYEEKEAPLPQKRSLCPIRDELEDQERSAIIQALEKAGGVQKDAAAALGISRRAIHYKIKKYGIEVGAGNRSN